MPEGTGWLSGGVYQDGDSSLPPGRYAWFNPLSELCLGLGKDSKIYRWWYNAVGGQCVNEVVNLAQWDGATFLVPDVSDACFVQRGIFTVFYERMLANFLARSGAEVTFEENHCPQYGT